MIEKELSERVEDPDAELAEPTGLYRAKGLSPATAAQVAVELTAHDALSAHLSEELNISQNEVANPWQAAYASAVAFTVGAVLPLLAILLPPTELRIPVTFIAVLLALALTGTLSAAIGGSSKITSAPRLVIGGALALAANCGIGSVLGASGLI